MYFLRPRKNCAEIAPEYLRMYLSKKETDKEERLKRLQSILQRARIKNTTEKIQRVVDLDKSDRIIYHGEVSKRMYKNIIKRRDFDLYGRPIAIKIELLDEKQKKLLAAAMGEVYHQVENIEEKEAIKVPPIFEPKETKILPLTTPGWTVGKKFTGHAPVGFANNPDDLLHSLGNEGYYSYNGTWKEGMMDGEGEYLYSDGKTYRGGYKKNRPSGIGRAEYPGGSSYMGYWEEGYFHGHGKMTCPDDSSYEGDWVSGVRQGRGKMVLPCGLEYEGEWLNGMPHGRGYMSSKVTGYAYDGNFYRGSICGGGTFITPPPESKKMIRFFPYTKDGMSLPKAVSYYLKEKDEERRLAAERSEEMFRLRRSLLLKKYSVEVRKELHDRRAKEKKAAQDAAAIAARDEKLRLLEAKVKAYEDDRADEA